MTSGVFLTLAETANALGVSTRHARRLAHAGALTKVARGLVARDSVDRYLASQRQGRTRSWAEHTAWGAIALLGGQDAEWLGATQTSRLRGVLCELSDPAELLTRTRDRAGVQPFTAHRAALPRLRDVVIPANLAQLGIVDAGGDRVDGYIAADILDTTVRSLGLQADGGGNVLLRVTAFDFDRVAELAGTRVVAALDAATSLDPRMRGVGQRSLTELLEAYRRTNRRPSKVGRVTIAAMTDVATSALGPLSGPTGRLVAAHRGELLDVLRRHGVTNARLFGSVARGDDHEGSDVDILVDFAPGTGLFTILKIQAELEEILGIEVDLVPDAGLKDRVRMRVEPDLVAL